MAGEEETPNVSSMNLYDILEVQKDATAQEITLKYRKLALKYHPDRNRGPGQEEAKQRFQSVSQAYAVLKDPSKRRMYDLQVTRGDGKGKGSKIDELMTTNEFESMDVKEVGWATRFLAAQMAKLGVPIPTSLSVEVLARAQKITELYMSDTTEAGSSGDSPARPITLQPGMAQKGSLPLAEGAFFLLPVGDAAAKDGVILCAHGRRKNDRFRLMIFDKNGDVRYQAEASHVGLKRGEGATCRYFLTPYPSVMVGPGFPSLDETPPVCHALDTIEMIDNIVLEPGVHLVCIYCENYLSSIDYTLAFTPAEPAGNLSESDFTERDNQLREQEKREQEARERNYQEAEKQRQAMEQETGKKIKASPPPEPPAFVVPDDPAARAFHLRRKAETIKRKRDELNELARDFQAKRDTLIAAQQAMEEVVNKAKQEDKDVQRLVQDYAAVQSSIVAESMRMYGPPPEATPPPSDGGLGSFLGGMFGRRQSTQQQPSRAPPPAKSGDPNVSDI